MGREQRIAARRQRIAEKITAMHAGEATGQASNTFFSGSLFQPCSIPQCLHLHPGDDKAVSKEELGKGRQQVSESRSRLLKMKAERDLEVSAVRVTGDERESQRRSKEEEERQVRIAALQQLQRQ